MRWNALKRLSLRAIETSEFQGALLSGQNRAAQQGKTKKLSFNALSIDAMTGTVKHVQF
jgi:hypothetical protein